MNDATPIHMHEGKKYLRLIRPAHIITAADRAGIWVDVYCVSKAFGVHKLPSGSALDHALKKILCSGERGKGSRIDDIKGAIAALNRAIELEEEDEENTKAIPELTVRPDVDDVIDNVAKDVARFNDSIKPKEARAK